jgi:SAM-dependent methyltransferase
MINLIKFPLYEDDKRAIEIISKERNEAVKAFEKKIENKEYFYIENSCLCGNRDKKEDILLSKKDRYGISVRFLLCKRCSLIRTDKKLDSSSMASFYSDDYRKIYGHGKSSISDEYYGQVKKGTVYKTKLQKYINLDQVKTIFDYGCGTGGVLIPFDDKKKRLYGSDYDQDRLNYGKEKGLWLFHAQQERKEIEKQQYDLVILSHVMEHFSNPIESLNEIFNMVSYNGHILIIVPSPLYIGKSPYITCRFFQNVHLYNFNKDYLDGFFQALGMEVVYSDEESFCVLKKPENWRENSLESYHDRTLKEKYKEILFHFQKVVILNDIFKISTIQRGLVSYIITISEILGIKSWLKSVLGR